VEFIFIFLRGGVEWSVNRFKDLKAEIDSLFIYFSFLLLFANTHQQGWTLGNAKSSTDWASQNDGPREKNYCSISPPHSKKKNKHVSCFNF